MKYCNGCDKQKSDRDFYPGSGSRALRSRCKSCEKKATKKYRKENADRWREIKRNWHKRNPELVRLQSVRNFARRLGYDPKVLEDWYKSHNGKCDICGVKSGSLHIDHCHQTNEIRGLLCGSCNLALGHFKSNPRLLRKAAKYLE
jgi:hypothetical protein